MVEGYETRRKIDFIIDKGVTDRKSNISNGKITSILLSSSTREGRKKEPRDIGSYEAYTGVGQVCKSQSTHRVGCRPMSCRGIAPLGSSAIQGRQLLSFGPRWCFVRTTHITNLTRRVAPTLLLFFSSPVKGALANLEDARPFYP